MKQTLGFLFVLSVIFSCTNSQNDATDTLAIQDSLRLDSINNVKKLMSEDAKTWLIKSIENEFADPLFEDENQDKKVSIYTKSYEEYKTDAISIDYDGGMTEEAFKKKWGGKYDTKYAGIGTGFLISGQDWVKISITNCTLKSDLSTDSTMVFDVMIEDKEAKAKYKRDIKVIKSDNSFLIDDVLEYQ
jgi:macrodomain Ter protein organizer (MatP/YcbG family)